MENKKRYTLLSTVLIIFCTIWFVVAGYFSLFLGMLGDSGTNAAVYVTYYIAMAVLLVPPILVGFYGTKALKKKYGIPDRIVNSKKTTKVLLIIVGILILMILFFALI